ncbi:PREDICTED: Down syndrome cell adhesion molecule-like protein Dscam2 [Cyphomyrmex costatus]|uniref:Down syndrome cell adhesion molecule-like protein Dscam2 n=1 Tax=Cyphomyrmex costatus TaxID=456900 RepID=UPI0008521EF2|nr:PREDICTED: Down syndrome cell adhesion molecule-like protein Dscam2 [Cyphomyrmex costatus]
MVEKGDPPFTIIWSKDGEQISASGTAAVAYGPAAAAAAATINDLRQHSQTPPGLRVTNIDAHSSAIVIERVTAAHTGNYTCLARNSVAEVLWTAELIVHGKVK